MNSICVRSAAMLAGSMTAVVGSATALGQVTLTPVPVFQVNAISGNGRVLVGDVLLGGVARVAVRWSAEGGQETVPMPITVTLPWSRALAVSDDGNTVAGEVFGSTTRAAAWNEMVGGFTFALPLNTTSRIVGVSGDGMKLVGMAFPTQGSNSVPFLGDVSAQSFELLPAFGNAGTVAAAISRDGNVVVGGASNQFVGGGSEQRAFRWTRAGGYVDLGPVPWGINPAALHVSGDGSIIMGTASGVGFVPFGWRWTSSEGMVASSPAIPLDMTDDGRVTVGYFAPQGSPVALDVITIFSQSPTGQWLQKRSNPRQWLTAFGVPMPPAGLILESLLISGDGSAMFLTGRPTVTSSITNQWLLTGLPAPTCISITRQPSDVVFCPAGGNATVTVGATGYGAPTYQWQLLQFGNQWNTLVDGNSYAGIASVSGSRTATLSLGGVTSSVRVRVVASDLCADETSREVRIMLQPGGYANCDGSTTAPVLNALDFACFLSRYQAAQSLPAASQVGDASNCDGSTTPPVLNALDFACFLSRYQAGCP